MRDLGETFVEPYNELSRFGTSSAWSNYRFPLQARSPPSCRRNLLHTFSVTSPKSDRTPWIEDGFIWPITATTSMPTFTVLLARTKNVRTLDAPWQRRGRC